MRYLQRDDDDRFFTPVTKFFLLVLSSNDVACLFGPSTDTFEFGLGWALLFCIATKELHYWSKTFKPSSTAKKAKKIELLHDLGNLRSWMIWWARFIYLLLITDISYYI